MTYGTFLKADPMRCIHIPKENHVRPKMHISLSFSAEEVALVAMKIPKCNCRLLLLASSPDCCSCDISLFLWPVTLHPPGLCRLTPTHFRNSRLLIVTFEAHYGVPLVAMGRTVGRFRLRKHNNVPRRFAVLPIAMVRGNRGARTGHRAGATEVCMTELINQTAWASRLLLTAENQGDTAGSGTGRDGPLRVICCHVTSIINSLRHAASHRMWACACRFTGGNISIYLPVWFLFASSLPRFSVGADLWRTNPEWNLL